ncbi:MAG: S-layer homology domain-containing protein [Caldiserica bacterium]|jgi:WD40 repeat protein|nr:S-layer homology domain-containing protein [Caldisericota bacterium]MDH7561869.1 S-layer homology domain-containing protein [Caldisericota bacterium]
MKKLLILTLVLALLPLFPVRGESQFPYLSVNATERLTVADVVSPRYAPDGSYIAFIAKGPNNTIVYADPDGSNQRQIVFIPNPVWSLNFSPDGSKLILIVATTGKETGTVYTDVVTVGTDGKTPKFLTNSTNYNSDPMFLPDGRIAFTSQSNGVYSVWVMNSDGSEQRMWINPGLEPILLGISPSRGEALFMGKPSGSSIYQLFLCDLNGKNVRQITNYPGGARAGTFSPDGERIAFVGGEEGRQTIAIVNRDGTGQYSLANLETSLWRPSWSPDGQFIVFPALDKESGKFRIFSVLPDGNDLRVISPDFLPSVTSQVQWKPWSYEVIFLAQGEEGTNNLWRMQLQKVIPEPPPPPPPPPAPPAPEPTQEPQAPSEENLPFSDISTHWAKENIIALKEMGIVQGFPDGTYRPLDTLKRVEFAAFLLRALGFQEVTDVAPFFNDLPSSHWGFGIVQALVLKKIIARDTNFFPEDNITRLEIVQWEVRALGLEEDTVYRSIPDLPFSDLEGLTDLERKYVATAYELKLITGYPDGTLRPYGFATRGEATALLFRLLENLKK